MHHHITLKIDLSALVANYQLLSKQFTGKACAAVVKADAYGLGVAPVAKTLWQAGCRTFFVATLKEGVELRSQISPLSLEGRENTARIFIFHGPFTGEEKEYVAHQLTPILNSVDQITRWNNRAAFGLHVDTGMCRLGLTHTELVQKHAQLTAHNLQLLLSHLACANEANHPKNQEQLARFQQARALLPATQASLCNSAGIFLDKIFHHDLARPGCALYGIEPQEGKTRLQPVVTLTAPIIQIRTLDQEESVGYGATTTRPKGAKIAIIHCGYADGYLRSASNKSSVTIAGKICPVIGRVSMDMIAADISAMPDDLLQQTQHAELLGKHYTVNHLAADAETIGYEVLTRLGKRVHREYY